MSSLAYAKRTVLGIRSLKGSVIICHAVAGNRELQAGMLHCSIEQRAVHNYCALLQLRILTSHKKGTDSSHQSTHEASPSNINMIIMLLFDGDASCVDSRFDTAQILPKGRAVCEKSAAAHPDRLTTDMSLGSQ